MDQFRKNIELSQGYVRSISSLNAFMIRGIENGSDDQGEAVALEHEIDPAVASKVIRAIEGASSK